MTFKDKLSRLKTQGLYRTTRQIDSDHGRIVRVSGRLMVNFASNNYLGLAGDPRLKEAAAKAIQDYGWGSGASRLMSGTNRLHEELEERIAAFKGTESAILFNSGYTANVGVIPVLADEKTTIISDALNHASLIDGIRLSKAEVRVFRHLDMIHLEELLSSSAGKKMIVTDSVFSMDGDIAPLNQIAEIASRHNSLIYVDDAHGICLSANLFDNSCKQKWKGTIEEERLILMGTLSKALGSIGAFVAGCKPLVEYIRNLTRSFIYTTSLPPAACAASIAAIKIIEKEGNTLRQTLFENCRNLTVGFKKLGITADAATPIFPIVTGEVERTLQISSRLEHLGIFAPAVRPPTVAADACRIRISLTAAHSQEDIDLLLAALHKTL